MEQIEEIINESPFKRQKTSAASSKAEQSKAKKSTVQRRTNIFAATGALLAAGITLLDNAQNADPSSQALVEVKSEFMSLAALNDPDFGKPLLGPDYVHPG